jgi:hypothetical protein
MERQATKANEMIDRKSHVAADLYLHGTPRMAPKNKRQNQMLLRLAQANGLPDLVRLAKNWLDSDRRIL